MGSFRFPLFFLYSFCRSYDLVFVREVWKDGLEGWVGEMDG